MARDGAEKIMAAIATFADDAVVVKKGFQALHGWVGTDATRRRTAAIVGVIEAAVNALVTHRAVRDTCIWTLWAVGYVIWGHPVLRDRAGAAGLVEACVAVMVGLPEDRQVQENGCFVLSVLTEGQPPLFHPANMERLNAVTDARATVGRAVDAAWAGETYGAVLLTRWSTLDAHKAAALKVAAVANHTTAKEARVRDVVTRCVLCDPASLTGTPSLPP